MSNEHLRRLVYRILALVAVAAAGGRIANTELLFEPSFYRTKGDTSPGVPPRDWPEVRPPSMPTHSSNDRSRWCTVRALVDHGTWAIGRRIQLPDGKYEDTGIVFEDGWKTIDRVKHPETDLFYSSKPPLLTALVAAEYWLLKNTLGWSITKNTNHVVKTILVTFNLLPMVVFLILLAEVVERLGVTDWGRISAFATGCFGTFIGTFAITLNNHTPAATLALAAMYPILMSVDSTPRRLWFIPLPPVPAPAGFVLSGLCAGLLFCLELPALSLTVLLGLALGMRDWKRTLILFLPAALLPTIVQLALNYSALGQFVPAYAKFGGPWYEYPGSHWLPPAAGVVKRGIDWARLHESRGTYMFHVLFGHHGLFSLTPVWLLAFAGMFQGALRAVRNESNAGEQRPPMGFTCLTVLPVSLVVIGFYLVKSDNYGGHTSVLRWLIWLGPLWCVALLPAADWLGGRRWGRWLALVALGLSVFSANFPGWNPWRHPWIYRLMEACGWPGY